MMTMFFGLDTRSSRLVFTVHLKRATKENVSLKALGEGGGYLYAVSGKDWNI